MKHNSPSSSSSSGLTSVSETTSGGGVESPGGFRGVGAGVLCGSASGFFWGLRRSIVRPTRNASYHGKFCGGV